MDYIEFEGLPVARDTGMLVTQLSDKDGNIFKVCTDCLPTYKFTSVEAIPTTYQGAIRMMRHSTYGLYQSLRHGFSIDKAETYTGALQEHITPEKIMKLNKTIPSKEEKPKRDYKLEHSQRFGIVWNEETMGKLYTQDQVDILLAEQHRNTRHDAADLVEKAFNDANESREGSRYPHASNIARDITNLKQRKP